MSSDFLTMENGLAKYGFFNFLSFSAAGTGLANSLLKFFKGGYKQINIRVVNAALFLGVVLLAVYLVNNVSGSFGASNKLDLKVPAAGKVSDKLEDNLARTRDLGYYTDKIKQRDIFRMGPKMKLDAAPEIISSKVAEATKDLKLVGISWSDNPDAIIEDTKGSRTYFVKKGDMIGEIKVDSISREKVMLRYEEEMIELR